MSEQKRTRTRRKLKFIVFPIFTSIFATRKKSITKQGTKLFLQTVLDIYKVYMKLCRMSQKNADR